MLLHSPREQWICICLLKSDLISPLFALCYAVLTSVCMHPQILERNPANSSRVKIQCCISSRANDFCTRVFKAWMHHVHIFCNFVIAIDGRWRDPSAFIPLKPRDFRSSQLSFHNLLIAGGRLQWWYIVEQHGRGKALEVALTLCLDISRYINRPKQQ